MCTPSGAFIPLRFCPPHKHTHRFTGLASFALKLPSIAAGEPGPAPLWCAPDSSKESKSDGLSTHQALSVCAEVTRSKKQAAFPITSQVPSLWTVVCLAFFDAGSSPNSLERYSFTRPRFWRWQG